MGENVFEKILNNLVAILKSNKTREFAEQSIENIASICMGDYKEIISSGIIQLKETGKYIESIKDVIF